MTKSVDDDVACMREVMRRACWDLYYHERELTLAHKKLGAVKAFIARCGIEHKFTDHEAMSLYDSFSDEDKEPTDADQFARYLVGDALNDVRRHEDGIQEGHRNIATAKKMMARGKYTEFTVDEVMEEVKKRESDRVRWEDAQ